MARWEPNARERLVRAALDLFTEQGYDNTAVAQIAERAGLTKTTFFRHFADKREVLFTGQQEHAQLLAEGCAAAPATAGPLEAAASGLDALTATFTADRLEYAPRLRAVISANAELRERAAYKRASLVEALTQALRERQVPEPTASLAAELAVRAYYQAFDRWIEPGNSLSLTDLTRRELAELRAAAAALG